ncbi:hypothetical protein, partial [Rathayibacter tanaceti]|uniref:hypothetical protein n=1 Tax=Rathayibacter tanaceti TaxID=1671680 RepID=UPI001F3C99D7
QGIGVWTMNDKLASAESCALVSSRAGRYAADVKGIDVQSLPKKFRPADRILSLHPILHTYAPSRVGCANHKEFAYCL